MKIPSQDNGFVAFAGKPTRNHAFVYLCSARNMLASHQVVLECAGTAEQPFTETIAVACERLPGWTYVSV